MDSTSRRGLRLASFDGGGPRSIAQLKAMGALMHRVQYDNPGQVILPGEYFDMMGGSDTGGILAIMFTKLRMTVEEATQEFDRICKMVYLDKLTPTKRTLRLRTCLQDLLFRRGLPLDLKMGRDFRAEDACPGFVVATPRVNINSKVKFRTYQTRLETPSDVTVIDALLSTCATPPAFDPACFGTMHERKEFVGGAVGAANPIRELITEAHGKFKDDSRAATIVSFGSGNPGTLISPPTGDETAWAKVAHGMTVNCEQTAQEIDTQMGHLGIYFRFSVEQGLQDVYSGTTGDLSWLTTQAMAYLEEPTVVRRIEHCVESLKLRQGRTTLSQLKHTGGATPVFKGLPPLTAYFIMRQEPWGQMVREMLPEKPLVDEQLVMVISGMGGCGKTQLAIKFMKEFKERFRFAFFVDGSSKESIQADLIDHVRSTDAAYSQATFADAMSFFCNPQNLPWLLVYDNLDDADMDLAPLLPQVDHGLVVLTTRNRLYGEFAPRRELHLELDVMSDDEACHAIFKSARLDFGKENMEHARAICEELGNLPVALIQAGSYIYQSKVTFNEYLNRLRRQKARLMDMPAGDRQRRSAYATFDLSYNRLSKQQQNLLHIMGAVHFANFPLAAIEIAAKTKFRSEKPLLDDEEPDHGETIQLLLTTFCPDGEWDEFMLDDMAKALQNYSLASIARTSNTRILRMHPLMHDWAFSRLNAERKKAIYAAASRLISCASNEHTLLSFVAPHIDALLMRSSSYTIPACHHAAFAHVLWKMHRLDECQVMWQHLHDTLVHSRGKMDYQVAKAAIKLAATFELDLPKMEFYEAEAVEILDELRGPNNLETLQVKGALSGTYRISGKLDKAEVLGAETLKQLEELLGPDHAETYMAIGWLAAIYYEQGRYEEAAELQHRVWKGREIARGHDHPATLNVMAFLAQTLHAWGKHADAEELQMKVIKKWSEHLGESHPETLHAMEKLAITYHSQTRAFEAEELREKILQLSPGRQPPRFMMRWGGWR